ncbi:MAG: DUF2007 domain-containing protein [Acidobacteriota bacterium]|nr:DUF2007 domain-containing protein [Acidobacteriota bacterium]
MSETQGQGSDRQEETVAVHRADSWAEAMVIRGLLESAGIASPPLTRTDPYPFSNPPADFPGAEILVRESQVEEARRIIADYLSSPPPEPPENDEDKEPEAGAPHKS